MIDTSALGVALTSVAYLAGVSGVIFTGYQAWHRTIALKRFKRALHDVPRGVGEEDMRLMLDALRKLEQEDELRNVEAVIGRMEQEKDRSALAYAFTRLDPVSQRFMADMVADPSDATRRRFLKHAAEAA